MIFIIGFFKRGSRLLTSGHAFWRALFVTALALQATVARASAPPVISYLNESAIRGISQDWDYGFYKANCGPTEALLGVSEFTDSSGNGNLALCAPFPQPGNISTLTAYVANSSGPDNRGFARHGNWAPGYTKVECGLDQYGVAISQSIASPRVAHGIACVQGAAGTDVWGITTVRQMDNNSSVGSTTWGDWDPNKYKGQCIDGESIVGASFSSAGRLHSVLCRGPATMQMLYQPSGASGVTVATVTELGATPTVRSLSGLLPKSGTPPAITNFQGSVYALYASSTNVLCIAQSPNRGLTYASPTCLQQVSINDTPAVLSYNGTLYVAYASTTTPRHLMVASSTDGANFNVTSYDAIALDASPGLAALDGVLYAGYVKSNTVCVSSLQSTRQASKSCQFQAKSQPVGMVAAFGNLVVTYANTQGQVSYMVSQDPSNLSFNPKSFAKLTTASLITPVYYHGNIYLVFNDVLAGAHIEASADLGNWYSQPTTGMSTPAGAVGAAGTNIADTVPGTLFAVYGDMPYNDSDATLLSTKILPGLSSSANVPFILHMGDAGRPNDGTGTAPYDSCSDSFRSATVQSWWSINQPLVFTPGDNDWTDCNQERTPRSRLDPLREFGKVRSIFSGNVSLDAPRYTVDGLGGNQPALSQTWVSNGVLYLSLNIVGSYNGYVASSAINAAARNAEASVREAETLTAISNASAAMTSNPSLNALVVAFHIDPYYGTAIDWKCSMTDSSGRQPYKAICANLVSVANAIGKPMLVVHGDTVAHCFRQHPEALNLWVLNAPGDFDPGVDLVSFNPANGSAPFSVVTMTNSAGSVPGVCDYSPKLATQNSRNQTPKAADTIGRTKSSGSTTQEPEHLTPTAH